MLRHVSAVDPDHLHRARKFFLKCAACATTHVVGTLHYDQNYCYEY